VKKLVRYKNNANLCSMKTMIKFTKKGKGSYIATQGNITIEIVKQDISKKWSLSAFNELTQELIIETYCKKKSHCIEYINNAL